MSTARGGRELPVSEEQLTRLTRETDEAHRATLPVMRRSAAGLAERLRDEERERAARPGRRTFLLGATGVGAAFALAACSGGANSASAPADIDVAGDVASKAGYSGDLRLVALSVALENQAVGAYKATLAAAKAGRLGTVPPAVSTFVSTAMAQHADHAETWNSVLTGAGKPAVTDVPLSNQKEVAAALGRATSVSDAAELALTLEDQAAQTYLYAMIHVRSASGIETAATIAPVEAMHAAILRFVLGRYPVPDAFLPVGKAAKPSLLTV
ncbi:ferritin-like domain-containing protein [Streptomyces griseoviridis]